MWHRTPIPPLLPWRPHVRCKCTAALRRLVWLPPSSLCSPNRAGGVPTAPPKDRSAHGPPGFRDFPCPLRLRRPPPESKPILRLQSSRVRQGFFSTHPRVSFFPDSRLHFKPFPCVYFFWTGPTQPPRPPASATPVGPPPPCLRADVPAAVGAAPAAGGGGGDGPHPPVHHRRHRHQRVPPKGAQRLGPTDSGSEDCGVG